MRTCVARVHVCVQMCVHLCVCVCVRLTAWDGRRWSRGARGACAYVCACVHSYSLRGLIGRLYLHCAHKFVNICTLHAHFTYAITCALYMRTTHAHFTCALYMRTSHTHFTCALYTCISHRCRKPDATNAPHCFVWPHSNSSRCACKFGCNPQFVCVCVCRCVHVRVCAYVCARTCVCLCGRVSLRSVLSRRKGLPKVRTHTLRKRCKL